ncbi:hypothetical protein [Hymenobacter metallilatus]|uniref:DUF885 family protein n=1 Tax=Hymenobacter metallilatus TaxID=2493666 RepID=A0A3R9NGB2_9BACT|nr:hypothetical protein [Hymenobacter metallilatus]RSK31821.1 hypothetical protein EI290_13460 [Hymenobacter metallilatus]
MKIGILVSCAWLGLQACQAQPTAPAAQVGEFGTLPTSGLLYSPRTMSRLHRIVDSLNLRYKVCEMRRAYRSQWQGQASYLRLEKGNLDAAAQLLKTGVTPEQFRKSFPAATVEADLLVVAAEEQQEHNGRKLTSTEFSNLPLRNQGEYSLTIDGPVAADKLAAGKWMVHQEKKGYGGPYLEAFYFPQGLSQAPLPRAYATLVQYADCLVDTTAQIYLETARRTGVRLPTKESNSQVQLLRYVHEQTRRPDDAYHDNLSEEEQQARWQAFRQWDSLRLQKVDALAGTPRFRALLQQAATDDASLGNSTDELEEYVARYYSPARALQLKRSRRVIGGCSQDNSPRLHALGIAQLSAEAVHWETFLRAHLDIMNDRFERMSDGSYAWEKRQTYLRELEELDINVTDLLVGISLRMQNPSQNHYYGSISRVGRALAETKQPRQLEQRLLALVADPDLDTYNRLLAYYLFLNYNRHLPDAAQQARNITDLNTTVQKLPAYLVARATISPQK